MGAVAERGPDRRDDAGRHERRHLGRGAAVLAEPGTAREASAQVGAKPGHVLGSGLPVRERRQQRSEPLALRSGLDPRDPLEEAPPALAETAVHLRVRPARRLADLSVGEAVRTEEQSADLLRLELAHRLRAQP